MLTLLWLIEVWHDEEEFRKELDLLDPLGIPGDLDSEEEVKRGGFLEPTVRG
jgi:hypothetical protein